MMRTTIFRIAFCAVVSSIALAQESLPESSLSRPSSRTLRKPDAALSLERRVRERLREPVESLDLELVMLGEDFVGTAPTAVTWADDSRSLQFTWKRWDDAKPGLFEADVERRTLVRINRADERTRRIKRGVLDRERKRRVVSDRGDIFLADLVTGETRRLTETSASEDSPVFSADGRQIVYVSGDNAFAFDLFALSQRQLTDIRSAPVKDDDGDEDEDNADESPPPESRPESQKDAGKSALSRWLKAEQRELLRSVYEGEEERLEARRISRRDRAKRKPYGPAPGTTVAGLLPSPNLETVLLRSRAKSEIKPTVVATYVTDDGYARNLDSRAKAGDRGPSDNLVLLDVETGRVSAVSFDAEVKPFSFQDAVWSPDGTRLVATAYSVDDEHGWVLKIDCATGKASVLHHVHDAAWTNSPSGLAWLPDSRHVFFTSEKSGFRHLYVCDVDNIEERALTAGRYEVSSVALSPDGNWFYFQSTEESPYDRPTYRMRTDGSGKSIVEGGPGWHAVTLSPDGRRLAVIRSSMTEPPDLFVRPADDAVAEWWVTHSPSPAFLSLVLEPSEIVEFEASDGTRVPAKLTRPLERTIGGPAVLFVHGAGYLQNVHRGWTHYYREQLFHWILAARGFTILDIDYRGSAGYGRDWRTAIYRHMGGRDLDDQVDGVNYLVHEYGVDPERVGIYGGSYGGFITLMALFKHPEMFAAGAALRPVTDWAHYNDRYTTHILNAPFDDEEAYRRSSPIYWAEGLRGRLLICHGLVDTNVHAQDSIRLVQRLIELRKTDFELALFPTEDHGFRDAASWTDEYRRILALFETL